MAVFVDTETIDHRISENEVEAKLQFGVAEYWANWNPARDHGYTLVTRQIFYSRNEFFDKLCQWKPSKKQCTWVIAHNMSFDFQVLGAMGEMESRGWSNAGEALIIESTPFLVAFRKEDQSLRFADLPNWYGIKALSEIAIPLGMAKQEDPGGSDIQARIPYCQNDVAILREAFFKWIEFCKEHDLGSFAISKAAQALNAFRHRFMVPGQIIVNHEEKVAEHERAGFYGGRTECFQMGEISDVHHLDVNSMYPSVMRDEKFPVKLLQQISRGTIEQLRDYLSRGYGCIAAVTISTRDPIYPLRTPDRLIFPTGTFCTTLSTPELQMALARDHIVGVGRIHVYQMEKIFTEFVEYFYRLRLKYKTEGNDIYQELCKIFMNCLYGKFGQLSPEWEEVDEIPPEVIDFYQQYQLTFFDFGGNHYRKFNDKIEVKVRRNEADNASCGIAAHVTAYGRCLLYSGMECAGTGHYYYGDTDSLFVDSLGRERMSLMVDSSKLGWWKDEIDKEGKIEKMVVQGAKDYELHFADRIVTRRKGIRAKAKQISENEFEQDTFVSLKGGLRRGHSDSQRIIRTKKVLTRKYEKGVVESSGRVIPFVQSIQIDQSKQSDILVDKPP